MSIQPVVIKAFKGIALNRWMVGTVGDVAIITDIHGAEAVRRGAEPTHSVGFPKTDIFAVPESPVLDGSVPNWAEMRHIFPLQ